MGNGTHNLLMGGHESLPPSQGPWCLTKLQHYKSPIYPRIIYKE
jgi:hypothetical protein